MGVSQQPGGSWTDDGRRWPPHASADRPNTWLAETVRRKPDKGKVQA
jgi:hypothetical protein